MPVLLGARIGCIWDIAAEIMGVDVMRGFESLAKWWIKGDNYNAINVLHAVVLWTLWKKRNNVCFQGECWRSVQELVGRCARTVKNWMLVNREGDAAKLDAWARELEVRSPSKTVALNMGTNGEYEFWYCDK
jgi:hypothetical protein